MDAGNGVAVAAYREQTVELALGPKGAFENGNVCTLTGGVLGDREIRIGVGDEGLVGDLAP
jgi:hypothetical protein